MSQHTRIPVRAAVSSLETWNQEAVFASTADWQSELDAVAAELKGFERYRGRLGESATVLLGYWSFVDTIDQRLEALFFYAAMNAAVDSLNDEWKAMQSQAMRLYAQKSEACAFEQPELLAIEKQVLLAWLEEEPGLAPHRKRITDSIRYRPHVQSAEIEAILGTVQEPFGSARLISAELTDVDFSFPAASDEAGHSTPVTQSTIDTIMSHSDRLVRKHGWCSYADTYLSSKNTLAATYVTSIRQDAFLARVRGHDSVLAMKLFNSHLPEAVFYGLLETFKKQLPVWERYWDVKRRFLGYESFHPYDIRAPLSKHDPEVPFETAVEWIACGMQPLGDEYVRILRDGCLQQRWVDRSINQGKRQGAFSYGSYSTAPYIMMSYANDIGSLSTLAHELGHSMHSYYTRKHQPYIYSHYSMFVAEVASNFNQALTRAYLFEAKADDREFQSALIQEAMDNFHRYFFIMPMLARFELEAHERVASGRPLSARVLNEYMADVYAEGYGSTMTDDRERTGITWAQFRHLYSPFYTFQYATGISAAHALADRVLKGEAGAQSAYLQFLSAGSALDPLEALQGAGVDMTGTEAIEKTFAVLSGLVDRLESLIP